VLAGRTDKERYTPRVRQVRQASKLTKDVRGQLTSRIALHYLLPELTKVDTEAILRRALGEEVPDEMVGQIHQVLHYRPTAFRRASSASSKMRFTGPSA
jgi:hypothetical protein